MAPATARSVMPGFTHHCIITRCASIDAAEAFLISSISPSSLIWRRGMVKLVTSCGCGAVSVPSVTAVKLKQRRGRGRIRLRPHILCERAVGGHQPAQLRGQLRHRLHGIYARRLPSLPASTRPSLRRYRFPCAGCAPAETESPCRSAARPPCGASPTISSAAPGSVQPVK